MLSAALPCCALRAESLSSAVTGAPLPLYKPHAAKSVTAARVTVPASTPEEEEAEEEMEEEEEEEEFVEGKMSAMFGRRRVGRCPDCSDLHLLRDPDTVNELSHSAPQWTHREECRQQGEILREQFQEMEEHVARLQDALEHEKAKSKRLQLRSNQQEAALRRQEQQLNRLKDRLTDRPRDKGPSMDVLNLPPGEQPVKTFRSAARREEAALRLVLERREAELREAMKLRHSLTTLLHALRVNMERTLSGGTDAGAEGKRLAGAEATLGDHVTGGVVQRWRQVQRRLGELLSEGQTGADTDQDKLLARLESDLRESQQLVRLQQQLLQLADGYFLEEWQRLQRRWAELRRQRRTFERERRSFTDAAVRLGRERCELEQQKASLLKQQYLRDSPPPGHSRGGDADVSFCPQSGQRGRPPITPSPKSGAARGRRQEGAGARTPDTPELYSALNLSYNSRFQRDGASGRIVGRSHGTRTTCSTQSPLFSYSLDRW
ncbi:hypothetical protein D4764_06G0011500 [Takifugu flavidus]|uniref:Afadin-and alpha-actinin-binding protein B n=1 Tax=Takifugu flavidus TaxID=433684 RepID=A0A5C6N1U9_9TELE|nr:hypothetical protein D4764_06G0011500 [Takifugu flavidus]